MKVNSIYKTALIFAALSLAALSIARAQEAPGEYKGRRLYRHAIDQAVTSYDMSCISEDPHKGLFHRYKESYDCKGLSSDAHFRLMAVANLKKNVLREIDLIPYNEVAFSKSEGLVGKEVLDRVVATTEDTFDVKCERQKDSMQFCNPGSFDQETYCRYRIRYSCGIKAVVDASYDVIHGTHERVARILFRP